MRHQKNDATRVTAVNAAAAGGAVTSGAVTDAADATAADAADAAGGAVTSGAVTDAAGATAADATAVNATAADATAAGAVSAIAAHPSPNRALYKNLAAIALPLALQNLITYGIGLADNFMVGSLGDLALSGVFLSNQVQWVLHMLCAGLSSALVVLAAQYLGKGDQRSARLLVAITLRIAAAVAVGLTVVVSLFPRAILGLFTRDQAVIDEGLRYIGVVCLSYLFFCASSLFLAALRCVQNTRIGFLCSLTGFCVNVFLNWVLIFGHLGAPALGVRGAALATLAARASECGLAFYYIRFREGCLTFRLADLRLWDRPLAADFFRYGSPVILGDIIWGIAGAAQVAILGRLGAEVLAANTIAANLHQMLGVVVYAIAGASGVIIGRTVGAGDAALVKTYARALQRVFVIFGVLSGLAIFLVKDHIVAAAFTGVSPEARFYAVQFLTVFSVTLVGTSYQMSVLTGIVRAGGATSFVLLNDLFWVWVVVIPSALLAAFVFRFPPVVVFACLKCDQILKCAVAVVKLRRWDWMKKLTR